MPRDVFKRNSETICLTILAVLVLAFSYRAAAKAAEDRSAFCRWRAQLLRLQDGIDISKAHNYPNPPVMAIMLEPLAHLPPLAGAMIWYVLKSLMAAMSLWWLFRLIEAGGPRFPPWARLLAVLLCLKPVLDDLSHGNVNLLILFLCVGTFAAYSARRDFEAGLLLALAVACKVTPALLIPYFIYKRAWRVLLGGVAGCLLFFYPGFVPAARLGMEHNLRQLNSWYDVMVKPFLEEGKVTAEHINQSLPGLVQRLGTNSPSFVTFEHDIETPARYDNFLDLSPTVAKQIVKGCLLLFALLVVLTCRTTNRAGWQLTAEFGLITLGMLLFSERTWKHHAVTLMVPFCVLMYRIAVEPKGRTALVGVLAVSVVLMLIPGFSSSQERESVWMSPGIAKMALVYGAYTAVFLLLTATLAMMLGTSASSPSSIVPLTDERDDAKAA